MCIFCIIYMINFFTVKQRMCELTTPPFVLQTQAVKFPGLEQITSLKVVIISLLYRSYLPQYNRRPKIAGQGSPPKQNSFINYILAALKPLKGLHHLELEDVESDVKLNRLYCLCLCSPQTCVASSACFASSSSWNRQPARWAHQCQ